MNKKNLLKLGLVCSILILVLVFLYSGLQLLESTVLFGGRNQEQTTSKTIERDGVEYYPRQDVFVMLLMGIDQEGKVEQTEYNQGGALDLAMLLIFDEKEQSCTILGLNRDTMVNISELDGHGKEYATSYRQLAYSNTFGDGMEESCENVKKTISELLYGISIDCYISLNKNAMALLNDAVGGVSVTVVDDFSQLDPSLTMGEVTLRGEQAVTFVQGRCQVGDPLDLSRMERQMAYMKSFVTALREKMAEQPGAMLEAYKSISDYIVTDCSLSVLSRLERDYADYPIGEVLCVEGESVPGEVYCEFYPDEEALDALILRLFYAPKK